MTSQGPGPRTGLSAITDPILDVYFTLMESLSLMMSVLRVMSMGKRLIGLSIWIMFQQFQDPENSLSQDFVVIAS